MDPTRIPQTKPKPSPDTQARESIALAIREGRQRAGLTLQQLASRVGFESYKPMWLIEHGRMPIPPPAIAPLEETLGLAPRSLFWAECRARLLRMGFDLDAALEELPPPTGSVDQPAPEESALPTASAPPP